MSALPKYHLSSLHTLSHRRRPCRAQVAVRLRHGELTSHSVNVAGELGSLQRRPTDCQGTGLRSPAISLHHAPLLRWIHLIHLSGNCKVKVRHPLPFFPFFLLLSLFCFSDLCGLEHTLPNLPDLKCCCGFG